MRLIRNRCLCLVLLSISVWVSWLSMLVDGVLLCFCLSYVYYVMFMCVCCVIFLCCRFGVWWCVVGSLSVVGLSFLWWFCRYVLSRLLGVLVIFC